MTKKKRSKNANFLFSMILAAAALFYFAYSEEPKVEQISLQPMPESISEGKSEAQQHSPDRDTPDRAEADKSPKQVPIRPEQFLGKANPQADQAKGGQVNGNPAILSDLPEDLRQQLNSPPPELPEDLKRQLEGPPPELPADLQAQLNAPPPELPEDIKRALQTPPRIVTLEEVNNPPQPGF